MIRPIEYKQIDPKYSSYPYSNKNESTNLGRAGCGVACSAMVIASLSDKSVTPIDTAKWALKHGMKYTGGGTDYGYFAKHLPKYGINCKQLNSKNLREKNDESVHKKALEHLKSGGWLIACMGPGNWTKGGHYILVYGYKDGYVYINDPASYKACRAKNMWSLLKKEVKYYWTIDMPVIKEAFDSKSGTDYQIKWLQDKLGVSVDGKWRAITAKAVIDYRKKLGWTPTTGYKCTEKMINKLK